MAQSELDRAVARATGENLRIISLLGFGPADPVLVAHDPEPCEIGDKTIDWDAVDAERRVLMT